MRIQYLFSSRHTRVLKSGNRHKTSVSNVIKEVIKISDVVLLLLDARFIDKTRNPEVEKEIKELGKKVIYVINKVDLVNLEDLKANPILQQLEPYVLFSCRTLQGRKELRERIKIEAKRGLKGKEFKIAHVGIVGYPNTGKSTLINLLVGRVASTTSSESGYTQGMQKIRLSKNILLLDSPGVIPTKEDNLESSSLKKQAEINAKAYNMIQNPELIVHNFMKENPGLLERYYQIPAQGDSELLIDELGKKNNFILKKNQVNTDRTARLIIRHWQEGRIKIRK